MEALDLLQGTMNAVKDVKAKDAVRADAYATLQAVKAEAQIVFDDAVGKAQAAYDVAAQAHKDAIAAGESLKAQMQEALGLAFQVADPRFRQSR